MNNTVKVNYYDTFQCTADKCPYTCCQEWDITFDEETRQKWDGVVFKGKSLHDRLEKDEDGYSIALGKDKQCVLLNENRLCSLVVDLDASYLCDICKTYPRNINAFATHTEYALDFGCPAVIDLLHQQGIDFVTAEGAKFEASLLQQLRDTMLVILAISEYTLTERVWLVAYLLLDAVEQGELTDELLASYQDEDYQDCLVSEMRDVTMDKMESFWERNELFLDITNLYRQEENYVEHLGIIGVWADKLAEFYTDAQIEQKQHLFGAQYIAYEKLVQDYLIAENWASMLQKGSTLEEMAMVFQWIVLEYCTMKQATFLWWLAEDEPVLTYEMVREYMMIVARLSAYDTSEVKNCMALSFDSTLLEWGHLALIVGNEKL